MRGLLAELALRRARANLRHSESAFGLADKCRHLERSYFWYDVSVWLDGLETWSELRRLRQIRRRKIVDPDAPLRISPKPRTGMGPGEAKVWLLIWFGGVAVTLGSFAAIGPQAWIF